MSLFPLRDLRYEAARARHPAHRMFWTFLTLAVLSGIGFFIYSGAAWNWFRPVLHKQLVNKYCGVYKLDPLWVMSIIKVESGFSPWARSGRGAVGLMQLLPSTAKDIASDAGLPDFQPSDLQTPDTNLHLGVYYLFKLQQQFPEDETAVLAAYNAGPRITSDWRRGKPALELEDIEYPETRRFVERVDRTYGFLKMVQGWKYLFGMSHGR